METPSNNGTRSNIATKEYTTTHAQHRAREKATWADVSNCAMCKIGLKHLAAAWLTRMRVQAFKLLFRTLWQYYGSRAKLLPYTNFYVEVLTQYRIKLLHVEVLTNVRIKLLHIEVLTIFPDKTSTLTKLIKNSPSPLPDPTPSSTSLKQDHL